jgi:hypothetical protein
MRPPIRQDRSKQTKYVLTVQRILGFLQGNASTTNFFFVEKIIPEAAKSAKDAALSGEVGCGLDFALADCLIYFFPQNKLLSEWGMNIHCGTYPTMGRRISN